MIRRERAKLSSTFRELCLLTLATPLSVLSCDETIAAVPFDASTSTVDASQADATSSDGASDAGPDGAPDPCAPVPYEAGFADSAPDFCANLVRLPCGLPRDVVPRDQCFLTLNDCDRFCQGAYFNCHTWDDSCVDGSIPATGPVTIDCVICLGGPGRRPRGLAQTGARPAAVKLGDVFADMAHLEAASVHAFRMLRRDLAQLGAPAELTRAAARAMRDEARHARVMSRLARRHGGKRVARVVVRATTRPSLEDFARENAVEGCVHETYAALLATWQAHHARDREVASTMARIASDETDHAALAWAVARFVEPRLTEAARSRVRKAMADAIDALERTGAIHGATPEAAGLPSLIEQRALACELRTRLWAEAA